MEETQCPVCGRFIQGSVEMTTQHVNHCIDNSQSTEAIGEMFTYELSAADLDGYRTFKYCPVCFKLSGVTAAHIKTCGKAKGIDVKQLIQMCGPDREEGTIGLDGKGKLNKTGGVKGKGKKTTKVNNSSPFGPGCVREDDDDPKKALKKPKPVMEYLFKPPKPTKQLKLKQPPATKSKNTTSSKPRARKAKADANQSTLQLAKGGLMFKLRKPIGISKGELTKLSQESKRERINHRINLLIANTIHPNNCVAPYYQKHLPYAWALSSLSIENVQYIVRGFERFCPRITTTTNC